MDSAEIDKSSSQVSSALDSHPLGGIPPEVWEKVFLFLGNDPESLWTCYNTCRTWNQTLEENSAQFLFQLCLSSLKRGYLPQDVLLQCRQICKKWCKAIDLTFQTPRYLHPDPTNHFGVPPYIWYDKTLGITLNNTLDVDKLAEDIASSEDQGKSLFFHKTVKLISRSLTNDDEVQRLFQTFTQFISEHGHLIQNCVYVACGGLPESERQLQNLFHFLPNLYSLAIVKSTAWQGMPYNNQFGLEWLYRQRDFLPPLPHLRSLNVFLDDSPIISEMLLISFGHQLESFHCDFRVISSCPYSSTKENLINCNTRKGIPATSALQMGPFERPISKALVAVIPLLVLEFIKNRQIGQYLFSGPLPQNALQNLKELSIFDGFGSSPFLERLLMFDLTHLETLSLNYVEVGPRRQSLLSILKILDGLKNSLKKVRLPNKLFHSESEYFAGENTAFMDEVKNSAKVKLTGVKKLGTNVELVSCSVRSRFLRKFPNLETLWVTNYGVTYGDNEKIEREMKTTVEPFWEMVPSLKKISVDRYFLGITDFYRD